MLTHQKKAGTKMIKKNVLIAGNKSYHDITNDIANPVETLPGKGWFAYFMGAQAVLISWIAVLTCIVGIGLGLLGLSHPAGWGTDITTFVFWIGIGHAGTLISAILFLFRQKWRTGIN